ncbi:MAG: acyltransferase [Polyangiaceae bacterium]|jgi:maltose O-acetyltransferase
MDLASRAADAARWIRNDRRSIGRKIDRGIGWVRAAILLRNCTRGPLVNAQGHVRVVTEGSIELGERVQFLPGVIPVEIIARPGAKLFIGGRCMFNYGVSIEAKRSIRIGRGCRLASMVRIHDFDDQREAPVTIGDDVWLAHGVIVEPGVCIGDGAVVSAGSVVVGDVPERTLAAGNPARHIPL